MTKHLYYTDSYQTAFDAVVVDCTTIDDQPAILLDQTFFYPTSGGQQFDLGRLAGEQVVDVQVADGQIVHLLAKGAHNLTPGQAVHGDIDWPRRFDHMQQHSGQHLLSYVFDSLFGFETVSVHFGSDESTLDLAAAEISVAQMQEAEQFANQLVYDNLPITAYFVDESEIARLPLRRPPKVHGQIRIVEIERRDYSACGGTHCRHTGELGLIRLTRQERSRGNVRMTFLCGWRAHKDSVQKHALMTKVASLFSTDLDTAPELAARMLEQNKTLERDLSTLQQTLMHYQALELLETATSVGAHRIVTAILQEQSPENVRMLATRLQNESGLIACLATISNGKLTLFCARAADVSIHMGHLLRDGLSQFGGGGGGRPEFAQGGGADPATADELMAYLLKKLQEANEESMSA